MSGDLSVFSREHGVFYEARPYDVLVQQRDPSGVAGSRRIHAGFDLDIYGTLLPGKWYPDAEEYRSICKIIQSLLETVDASDHCKVEVVPFPSSAVIDTHRNMQRLGMLRIKITHSRGLEQPAGSPERQALKDVEARLREAGLRPNGERAG